MVGWRLGALSYGNTFDEHSENNPPSPALSRMLFQVFVLPQRHQKSGHTNVLWNTGKQWPRDLEPTTFPLEGWELRYDEHVYLPLVVFPGGRDLGVVPLGKSGG